MRYDNTAVPQRVAISTDSRGIRSISRDRRAFPNTTSAIHKNGRRGSGENAGMQLVPALLSSRDLSDWFSRAVFTIRSGMVGMYVWAYPRTRMRATSRLYIVSGRGITALRRAAQVSEQLSPPAGRGAGGTPRRRPRPRLRGLQPLRRRGARYRPPGMKI